jgi:type II secretory pathway component PulC
MAEMSERRDREVAPLVSFEAVGKLRDLLSTRLELRRRWAISRPLLALNLFLAGLSVFFSIRIGHALFAPDLRSTPPVARPLAVANAREQGAMRNSRSSRVYDVIATKSLFDPNRAQPTSPEAMAPIPSPAPTVALYGVAISDDTRVAFVQDLATKQILGYRTGDKLAGGQVERIEPDRVVIMRADGPIEVLLRRPKEPQAAVPSPEEISPRRSRGRQD